MTEETLTPDAIHDLLLSEGWAFYGVILHYPAAYKDQGCIYTKDEIYIVSGLAADGKTMLREPIDAKDAIRRKEESLEELRELLFAAAQKQQ